MSSGWNRVWDRIAARDRSLDGWLTTGVVTTGIYCRPSCPGRPKRENVRFHASPAEARAAGLRACKRCDPDGAYDGVAVRHLPYRAPLAFDALLEFFGRRAVPGVEAVTDGVYTRALAGGVMQVALVGEVVAVRSWPASAIGDAERGARAMLDLETDPDEIAEALARDPLMAPLVAARPGLRVPGTADPHELAIRAVLGQQVSLAGAATLAGRLVAECGRPLPRATGGVARAFPRADVLADADPSGWAMPASRRRALQAMAGALASGEVDLSPGADPERAMERMLALPGIGPWTAGYVAMRALRQRDAFLASDLGVRHALDRLGVDSRPAAAERLSQGWRPFRAYALQHLWAVAA